MDQPATPARYCSCNRERAPMRRGRPRKTRRASMRRGLTTYLRLFLTGDSKRGRAAAPFLVCLEISPFIGRHRPPRSHTMGQRRPDALAAETDGRAKYGAADGPPFSFRTSPPANAERALARSAAAEIAGRAVRAWPSEVSANGPKGSALRRRSVTAIGDGWASTRPRCLGLLARRRRAGD